MPSLPLARTLPLMLAGSYSTATFALKLTLAGPNLTTSVASYDPSSCFSPSAAPSTHSTTARGSDSISHTARGDADTSIRSLTSIMGKPVLEIDCRDGRQLRPQCGAPA